MIMTTYDCLFPDSVTDTLVTVRWSMHKNFKKYSSVEYRSETPGVGGAMFFMEINPHPSVPGWEGGVMSFVDISLNTAGGSLIQASLPKPGQGRGVSDLIHYSICIY